MAALAGIKKVMTTYTARHGFADRSRRLGLPADMRDVLSHHSISQMEEYFAELERPELNPEAVSSYERVVPAVKQS